MSFDEYIKSFSVKFSKVKILILKTLWEASNDFPRDWVRSSYLLKLTRQKYFDRRIRELRNELGCDIETGNQEGNAVYRLSSDKICDGNPRFYLSDSQKVTLFERNNFTCQVCGVKTPPGPRGLQADHKVPLIRGGSHAISNWQSLCNDCNVGKRRACQDCNDDCEQCVWAYPERVGVATVLKLPHDIVQKISAAGLSQQEIEDIIIKALEKYLP